jgi:histone H2A
MDDENITEEKDDDSFASNVTFTSRSSNDRIKKKPRSMSKKAGLVFPAFQFYRMLKKGNYANIIRKGAGIYCTAVIEYLVAEVVEVAGDVAKENKKSRIKPRYLQLAIRNDDALDKVFRGVIIAGGGVIPHIHTVLLPVNKDISASVEDGAPRFD